MGLMTSARKICRISVNPERRHALWWDDARARFDAPTSLSPLLAFFGEEEISVDASEAEKIRAWAESLPDWDTDRPPIFITIEEPSPP